MENIAKPMGKLNSTIISKNTEDSCVLYLDSPISSMSGN